MRRYSICNIPACEQDDISRFWIDMHVPKDLEGLLDIGIIACEDYTRLYIEGIIDLPIHSNELTWVISGMSKHFLKASDAWLFTMTGHLCPIAKADLVTDWVLTPDEVEKGSRYYNFDFEATSRYPSGYTYPDSDEDADISDETL